MGRIFEKRKVRMFARWSKTAKAFTKVGKEISIAVKLGGSDPHSNPRLRMAIQTARSLNMPKDRIEAAINRAAQKDTADLVEIIYPGYGPHGVAVLVEAATDNGTRTVANVREVFTRYNGSLASAGSLDYLFKHRGIFKVKTPQGDLDALELDLIDAGLEEMEREDEALMIVVGFKDYGQMHRMLDEKKIEVLSSVLEWYPLNTVKLSEAAQVEIQEFIRDLEEDDDVQNVYHNTEGE
jgi:YebC/PmpR family DNA-binding regulatory protein